MVVFGGFAFGEKSNDIYKFNLKDHSWERIMPVSDVMPCTRSGHSAVLRSDQINGDTMYIFGGKDIDNNKLNDIWKFNLRKLHWEQVVCPNGPTPRSGHSSQIYREFMIIYGGIYEVTKELNDMHVFDMIRERWTCLFEELNSPQKNQHGSSPSLNVQRRTTKHIPSESPRKDGRPGQSTAQKKHGLTQPASSQGKRKHKLQQLKMGKTVQESQTIKLESPTSNTMKNCFLIKNADPSFEKTYAQIKKRAIEKERLGQANNGYDESLTKNCGKRPPARDGHTGAVLGDCFFVFGGDRHHMPFNDFHMLDLKSELYHQNVVKD
uniref:Uncharacterized protein n=1 Tax=Strombidium rassoulzadegani TaxID=1082188 RepID=A0A7S3FU64_9SPIT|mmetsp:Transcript_16421/g.27824  ORF Transcript_16421/g.27824 Transcript_16421/m.27824 type:complete len:322 (+) Transcript_16421:694-1659(+)